MHHVGYQNLVGSNQSSWGWDLSRKKAYHNRQGSVSPVGLRPNEPFHVPDKFYAVLNMDEGTLGFVVDNRYSYRTCFIPFKYSIFINQQLLELLRL